MFYLVLIILLIVGTLGVATYGGITMMQAAQGLSDAQTNSRRLEMIAWNMQNSGGIYSPANSAYLGRLQTATYSAYSIPDPTIFASPYTQSGVNFHDCPYSTVTTNGTTSLIKTPLATNDYTAHYGLLGSTGFKFITNTRDAANSGAVAADSDAPAGTVQIITSPSANANVPPQCNALTKPNDTTIVPGGSVVAITARQILNQHIAAASRVMNLYVAASVVGDGSGRDANNAMTLDQAMNVFRTVQPRVEIVNMAAGTYTATSATFASTGLMPGNPTGIKLVLRGASKTSTFVNVSAAATLDLPVDLQIEKMRLGTNNNTTNLTINVQKGGNLIVDTVDFWINKMVLKGGNLTVVGTGANNVNSANTFDIYPASKLQITTTFSYVSKSALTGINLYGGEISDIGSGAGTKLQITVPNVGTGLNVTSGIVNLYSNMSVNAATGTVAKGILILPAGQFYARKGIYLANNPAVGIDVAGTMSLASGAFITYANGAAVGVRLVSGGEFNLAGGATIGSGGTAPTIGVQDKGGTKVGGGSSVSPGIVNATAGGACWNFVAVPSAGSSTKPTLFSRSLEGDTTNSSPTDSRQPYVDYLQIDNRSYWTCGGPTPGSNPPAAPTYYTVAGSGDPGWSGNYNYAGMMNGKRYYTCTTCSQGNPIYLYYYNGGNVWQISDGSFAPYQNNNGASLYPPTSGWFVNTGGPGWNYSAVKGTESPAPSVTPH